ncbi:MAG: tetratricopeptide repeat protein, partial [Trueperaceae bacterium]|nr:tetratricopeptide repeat protein [Trueperaceae bacterium]
LFDVEGLSFPQTNSDLYLPGEKQADDYSTYDAVEMFINAAKRVAPKLTFGEAELSYVAQICQQVEGLPLALELAASWAKTKSPELIAQHLKQDFSLLETQHTELPERHRNLKQVFETTWSALSKKKRDTLARFTLFRGGASLEAAETITDTHFSILLSLVNESLLKRLPPDRFDIHELLKQYATEHLSLTARETSSDRYCHYYLEFAKTQTPLLHSEDLAETSTRLKLEQDNFRAVLDYALITGNARLAQELCGTLRNVWLSNGQAAEGLKYTEEALALDASPSWERARALRTAASLTLLVAKYEDGEKLLYESLELFKKLQDQENTVGVLNDLCLLYTRQGYHSRAKELGETALELAEDLEDPFYKSMVHNSLGGIFLYLGDYDSSKKHYEKALAINRKKGFKWSLASNLGNLSMILAMQGHYEEAIGLIREEISIKRELNSLAELAVPLMSLGETLCLVNDYEGAFKYLGEALHIARQTENRRVITYSLSVIAKIKMDLAEHTEAIAYAQEALELARANDFAREAITAHKVLMVSLNTLKQNLTRSLEHAESAVQLCQASSSKYQLAELLLYLAQGLESFPETAVTLMALSKNLQNELGIEEMEMVKNDLARCKEQLSQEDFSRAWQQGLEFSLEEGSSYTLSTIKTIQASLDLALG